MVQNRRIDKARAGHGEYPILLDDACEVCRAATIARGMKLVCPTRCMYLAYVLTHREEISVPHLPFVPQCFVRVPFRHHIYTNYVRVLTGAVQRAGD